MTSRRPMLDAALVAVALAVNTASLAAVAAAMSAHWSDDATLARVDARERDAAIARAVCISCGVVQSVRTDWGDSSRAEPQSGRYQVRVRLDNGTIRVLYPRDPPPVGIGDRVRIVNANAEIEG